MLINQSVLQTKAEPHQEFQQDQELRGLVKLTEELHQLEIFLSHQIRLAIAV